MRIHMLNSKIIHIQVYQVAKGGEGRGKFDMFGPQTATGGRIRSSIFFSYRVLFGKLRGGPRRIGPLLAV